MCSTRVEGDVDVRHVVHRQHDAGDDLDAQAQRQDAAEGPPVVQVLRRREVDHAVIAKPHDRQARVEPLLEAGLRLVGGVSAHRTRPPYSDLDLGGV